MAEERVPDAFGQVVRLVRNEQGRKQVDLAAAAGISAAYLSQIENAVRSPSWDTAEALAGALGVELRELISRAREISGLTGRGEGAVRGVLRLPPEIPEGPFRPGGEHFQQARQQAVTILENPPRLRRLAVDAATRARTAIQAGKDIPDEVFDLARLCFAHAEGLYRACPHDIMVMTVAALLYLVHPTDVIPDFIDSGYVDDAAVIAFAAGLAGRWIDDLRAWESVRVGRSS